MYGECSAGTTGLATGNRATLSSNSVGAGPLFNTNFPFALLIDLSVDSTGDLLVSEPNYDRLYLVNPTTGDRTVFSTAVLNPIAAVSLSNRDIVVLTYDGELFRLSSTDGTSATLISGGSPPIGAGPMWQDPYQMAVGANDTIYLFDSTSDAVYAADPVTGNRRIVSQYPTVGTGTSLKTGGEAVNPYVAGIAWLGSPTTGATSSWNLYE